MRILVAFVVALAAASCHRGPPVRTAAEEKQGEACLTALDAAGFGVDSPSYAIDPAKLAKQKTDVDAALAALATAPTKLAAFPRVVAALPPFAAAMRERRAVLDKVTFQAPAAAPPPGSDKAIATAALEQTLHAGTAGPSIDDASRAALQANDKVVKKAYGALMSACLPQR